MPTNILSKYLHQVSFVIKGIRKPLIIKRYNLRRPPIKLYWWYDKGINNFGDLVSQDIILNLFGYSTTWASPENCDLIAAGSIIEIAERANPKNSLYTWGSGFIKKGSKLHTKKIIFKAIRGKKSKSRTNTPNIPTGDPGILINATYLLKKKCHSSKIGVVIHYADMKTEIAKKIKKDPRFTIINPLNPPAKVAQEIADCGLVLSSSLHGLIFADSLSIPNAHIKISNNLTGGTYKFQDYYSGVDKKYLPADPEKIFDDEYLQRLKDLYQPIPNLIKKQRALIKAFPF